MTALIEIFKEVVDFEDYLVSNFGNVISTKCNKKVMLKPCLNSKGYFYVTLHKDRKMCKKYVHRLVAEAFIPNPENKVFIDHIDINTKNNNIINLRWATISENCRNVTKTKKRVTSSVFKGVSWKKSINKWVAQIQIDGKKQHLGLFEFAIDAARSYDTAAREHFKEFANTNF